MSKLKKILLCFLAVIIVCRIAMGLFAGKFLNAKLADIPGASVKVGKVNFFLLAGRVTLRDVEFDLKDSTQSKQHCQGRVEAIKLRRIGWTGLLGGKVSVGKLKVEKGSVSLESLANSMKLSVGEFSFGFNDIGAKLPEGDVEFNDSLYSVSIDSLDFLSDDGLSRAFIGHLSTADAGEIQAQSLHFYNCVPMEAVAEKMGKVAAMWYDAKLDSLSVGPLSIPKMIDGKRIDIESVKLACSDVVLFQDDRYPPAVPYPTLQEGLNAVKMPLKIHNIDAGIKQLTFIWETAPGKRGHVPMYNMHMVLNSVSNAPGNVMKCKIHGARKGRCSAELNLSIKNDKEETTQGTFALKNLDASTLNTFDGPLFGAMAAADIQSIDCSFQGDKQNMKADFCVLYQNLSVKVVDSDVASFLANALLPKANPAAPGANPKKPSYSFKRDVMQPYPAYLIQSIELGMMHTVLF